MTLVAVAVVVIALAGGAVVLKNLLNGSISQEVVSTLQQNLHRSIALGGVTGDLFHGIELRDLVIAERGGFSRGVTFSADHIRIAFDLRALLIRWRGIVGSISRVDLLNPHLAVRRDAAGTWNLADLFAGPRAALVSDFRGLVAVHDGSLSYADAGFPRPPFLADFARSDGTLDFRLGQDIGLRVTGRTSDGMQVIVTGHALPGAGTYDLDVAAQNGEVPRWAGYLIRQAEVRWRAGRFDGRIRLLVTPAAAGVTVDYTGTIHLTGVDAEYLPTDLRVRDASGDLSLDTGAVSTPGLTLVANGAPVWVRGNVAVSGDPWVDLVIKASDLDLAGVRAMAFPDARLGLVGRVSADVWVTGPLSSPYLDGDVTAARGRFNRQAFDALRTKFQYAAGILALEDLSASVGGGRVSGDALLNFAGATPLYQVAVTGQGVDASALASVGLPTIEGLAGSMTGSVAGVADADRIRLMAGITMNSGRVQDLAFDHLSTLMWDDGGAVALDYLGGRRGSTALSASGRVGPGGALNLDVVAVGVPLDEAGRRAGLSTSRISGLADALGHMTGTATNPVFSGEVSAADGHLGPVAFSFAGGDLRASPEGLRFTHFDLYNGAARYEINGGVAFHPLAAVRLRVDADGADAAQLAGFGGGLSEISGTLSGGVHLDGPLDRASSAGEVTLLHAGVGGRAVDRIQARFAGQGPLITLTSAEAQIGNSRVEAAGTVDLRGPVDVRLSAERIRLADLNAAWDLGLGSFLRGTISLSGGIRGTLRSPEVSGDLASSDLAIHGQAFQASGIVDYQNGVLRLAPLELARGTERYRLTGALTLGPRPSADLAFDVIAGRISTIVAAGGGSLPVSLDGTVNGQVMLSGLLADPTAHLRLTLSNGRLGEYFIDTGTADLTLSHGAIEIQRFQIQPARGEIDAKGTVNLGGTSAVEVAAQDLDPNILRPVFRIDQPLAGRLNFTVQFSGPTQNPTAGMSVEALDAGLPGVLADRIIALAYYKDGVVHIENASIAKGAHQVVIQGAIPVIPGSLAADPQGALQLHLALQDADLSLLNLISPGALDARGTVAGEVNIGGTVGAPQMAGFLRSSGGQVRYAPLPTSLDDLAMDITFSQDEVLVRDLSAAVGGGRVAAHGTVAIRNLRPDTLALDLEAKGATVDIPGFYTGRIDAAMALAGPASRPKLSGRATFSRGRVTYAPGLGPAKPVRSGLGLDVSLVAGENLQYAQGPIQAGIGGELHIGGTVERPDLTGRITALGGTVNVLGTPFALTEGTLIFPGGGSLDPEISARAQAVYGTTRVYLEVDGPASDLQPVWSSDPPMPQSEILALVAGTGGGSAVFGSQFGRIVLGSVGHALQQALRVDEFTIAYDTQNPITLRIGKFVIRNLYVSLSEVLPGPPNGTVPTPGSLTRVNSREAYVVLGLEYFLSPSVFLSYSVDTLGDSGIFLLTRLRF